VGDGHTVDAFVEKPDRTTAVGFYRDTRYLWNSGIYVGRPWLLLDLIGRHSVDLYQAIIRIATQIHLGAPVNYGEWEELEAIAFDYAVSEKAAQTGDLAVVRGRFSWDDVGDFTSLAKWHSDSMTTFGEDIVTEASTGLVFSETGRLVALLGVEDVVVVDTEDVLLVTSARHSQDVKGLLERLRFSGFDNV
jgi:mannose-1-phosphate guanylyltransferase